MPEKSQEENSTRKKLSETDPEEDGRSKEWQDRARVNLETVPEDIKTNVERDFEPESLDEDKGGKKKDDSVY